MAEQEETRQIIRPTGLNGKQFVLGVAVILAELALSQLFFNLLITLTGIGLLNALFYIFAVWLLVRFMRATVAGNTYVLNQDSIVLERHLGDSTVSVVTIPRDAVLSIRPAYCGEDLHASYEQVTYIRKAVQPSFRMRAAFFAALFTASGARKIAGSQQGEQKGWLIAFTEGQRNRACVFDPDEKMRDALREAFGDRMDWDDRLSRPQSETFQARALQRAFPERYPNVKPLVSQEDETWEAGQAEIREQKKQARLEEEAARQAKAVLAAEKKNSQKKTEHHLKTGKNETADSSIKAEEQDEQAEV